MKAKTIASEQVWRASDGSRTIWKVELSADDGRKYQLQTYSGEIAKIGFEGEVESYIGPRGDMFVRQPKQENGYKGRGGSKQNNQPVIQAQWAIGQARGFIRDRAVILPEDEYWVEVEKTAVKLIEIVNSILGGSESTNPKAPEKKPNPAKLKPGDPIWPSDLDTDQAAIERGMTATLAEMGTSNG